MAVGLSQRRFAGLAPDAAAADLVSKKTIEYNLIE
jgi:hypothetical protein